MTDSPSHLALRELRADFSNKRGLLALAGVGALLGISGPFGTDDILTLLPRIGYWTVIVYATYAAGAYVNMYMYFRGGAWLETHPARLAFTGIATGCAVMLVLVAINTLAFGWLYPSLANFLVNFAMVVVISTIIVGLLMLLSPVTSEPPQTPALLDRLTLDKRGALVSLSVQDHYVHVVTTKGTDMLLMRLTDAIRETAPAKGLQVHRSHWVATEHVTNATRVGDRAILTMQAGSEIPASRSYIPALRQAGLLPRGNNG